MLMVSDMLDLQTVRASDMVTLSVQSTTGEIAQENKGSMDGAQAP